MEAYNFAVASEDHNGYIFDMRNMKRALQVLVSQILIYSFRICLTSCRKDMLPRSCRSSSRPQERNSLLAATTRPSVCGSVKRVIPETSIIQSECSASSQSPGAPTTTMSSADQMTVMSVYGEQEHLNGGASSHLPYARSCSTTKHSRSDTSTCQRSSASTNTGISPRRSRRLARSRTRSSSLSRGRRRTKGDIPRRARSGGGLSVKR